MEQRPSFALSDATYHSFNDVELLEPPSPPNSRDSPRHNITRPAEPRSDQGHDFTGVKMQRQDSGYESYTASPRTSSSQPRLPPPTRHVSNGSSTVVSSSSRPRPRPSPRRSAKSYPQSSSQPLYQPRANAGPQPAAYFQFPTPDLVELTETPSHPDLVPLPPQTTHYWTSDDTRRLEYAAIDAASRGVKGWVRRHLVPDCISPRHVAFDDDTGSVRRYRLDLEDEQHEKEACGGTGQRRKGWHFWPLRKSRTL
ncbi:hypothetical protein TOPH_08403 [Tolypocladium ophioglossoides CBS 100239]|uniref:Uncharacterized protein n=1 Tax=Tolypocladium ophioglossoides (strain CBS 100239) TaxID=1163406 RepID=A0A0L0MYI5_TOLOC|nr:hypothetical protein TOPH_08403 [Tolypocladium ophioglossoides CBS 100239]